MVTTAKVTKGLTDASGSFVFKALNFSFLKGLAGAYSRIVFHGFTIEYRSFCGSTSEGVVTYGVAFDPDITTLTRAKIQSLTPCYEHQIWQSTASIGPPMLVPKAKLQSRKEYYIESTVAENQTFGSLCWAVQVTSDAARDRSLGDFWVTYHVTLSGTR